MSEAISVSIKAVNALTQSYAEAARW